MGIVEEHIIQLIIAQKKLCLCLTALVSLEHTFVNFYADAHFML